MAILGDLVVNLTARTDKFDQNLHRSERGIQSFKRVGTVAFAAVTAAITAMAVAIASKVIPQFEKLDKIAKLASSTGFQTESLIAWQHGATQAGVSTDLFGRSLQRMQRVVGEARAGSATARQAFQQLGIGMHELVNRSPEELLEQVAEAFSKMESAADKAAAANAIFGRGGMDMINFLQEGKAGLKAMSDEAGRLGMLFSAEELSQIEEANDAMDSLNKSLEAAYQIAAIEMAPALKDAAEQLTAFVVDNKDEIRAIARDFGEIARAAVEFGEAIAGAWSKSRDFVTDSVSGYTKMGEKLGILEEGTTKTFRAMRRGEGTSFSNARVIKQPEQPIQDRAPTSQQGQTPIQAFLNMGVTQLMQNRDAAIEAAIKVAQELERAAELQKKASEVIARNMTPDERFQEAIGKAQELREAGALSEEQFAREARRLAVERDRAVEQRDPTPDVPQIRFAQTVTKEQGAASAVFKAIAERQRAQRKKQQSEQKKTTSAVQAVEEAILNQEPVQFTVQGAV